MDFQYLTVRALGVVHVKDSIYSFYLYFISIISGRGGLCSLLHGFNKDQPSPVCRPPLSFSEDRSPSNGPELHADHLQHTHVPASAQKTHRGYVSEASLVPPYGLFEILCKFCTATVYFIECFHWRHAVLQHGRRIAQTDLDIQGSHMHHALEPQIEKFMEKPLHTIM